MDIESVKSMADEMVDEVVNEMINSFDDGYQTGYRDGCRHFYDATLPVLKEWRSLIDTMIDKMNIVPEQGEEK